jgi:hypothetical protein
MELSEEYHSICLKNKLQTNLKYYLLGSNKSYHLLYRVIDILKTKYNTNVDNINELERLKQSITNYSLGQEILRVEDWLVNWKNKSTIYDLTRFVDTNRNYELEEQIRDLQKQINELKEINLQQNPYIERIDENTNK